VKKPGVEEGLDYYKQIATIAPEDAAKPLEASDCPLVKVRRLASAGP
jgi:branched-chain amino acid transport system substrate-binding protein